MGMPTVPSADDAYTAVAVSVSPMPRGKKGVSMGGSHAGEDTRIGLEREARDG